MANLRVDKCLYKALGLSDREVNLPRFIVVNSWSEVSPGHFHLDKVARAVKNGIYAAGGVPLELNVPGLCSAFSKSHENGIRYDLPQRDVIASTIETAVESAAREAEGIVLIGTCDKLVPAMIMAAIRLDMPAIFVPGGPMLKGTYEGELVCMGAMSRILDARLLNGEITQEEYDREFPKLEHAEGYSVGACSEMVTGNSMQVIAEALGMTLPYAATAPAPLAERLRIASESGYQIVQLAKQGIKPSDIITKAALRNAVIVDNAVGGGTNAIVHVQAFAWEAQIDFTLKDWEEVEQNVPVLCHMAPSGPFSVCDLHDDGGIPALMHVLQDKLDLNCLTVTGKTVGENIAGCEPVTGTVIKSLDNPVYEQGAIKILWGNLAPRGAAVRHSIIKDRSTLNRVWNAKVYNSQREAVAAVNNNEITSGDVVVVRYEGPRGTPGMNEIVGVVFALNNKRLLDVAVITDGRFSGLTRHNLAVANICPEAAVGGPLAVVENGDKIKIDVTGGTIDLLISEEEMEKRLAAWKPIEPKVKKGVAVLYAKMAEQADKGAVWNLRIE